MSLDDLCRVLVSHLYVYHVSFYLGQGAFQFRSPAFSLSSDHKWSTYERRTTLDTRRAPTPEPSVGARMRSRWSATEHPSILRRTLGLLPLTGPGATFILSIVLPLSYILAILPGTKEGAWQ